MRMVHVALAALLGFMPAAHGNIGETPDRAVPEARETPDPTYEPKQVVEIVLRGLARPDHPDRNAGLATSFRFSTPDNRAQTGPLDRFIKLVNSPVYEPLVNHERAVRGQMVIEGDMAHEEVRVIADDGSQAVYAFVLARQPDEAPCGGCWLTDAVIRLEADTAGAT